MDINKPIFSAALFLLASACGDSATPAPAADAAADSTTGDSNTSDAATADTNINGCTGYQDQTSSSATRTISWQLGTPSGPSAAGDLNTCRKIRVGQTVTWNANEGGFSVHPLDKLGGDSTTPIGVTNTGTSKQITFPNAGVFGFHCQYHSQMMGAIQVVP